jgi:hypothetical protein
MVIHPSLCCKIISKLTLLCWLLQKNVVAYDELETPKLEPALLLSDAISELPKVSECPSPRETSYFRHSNFAKSVQDDDPVNISLMQFLL